MLRTSFGIGRSLLMLMLGLALIASVVAPAPAWAEEAPAEEPPKIIFELDEDKATALAAAEEAGTLVPQITELTEAEVTAWAEALAAATEAEDEAKVEELIAALAAATPVENPELSSEDALALSGALDDMLTEEQATFLSEAINEGIPYYASDDVYYEAAAGDNAFGVVRQQLTDFKTNNLWIMIAGMLVFIMHLGFACVESGLTRAKNTVNILFKNVMIVMIGIVMYGVCGWLIMYPGDNWIVDGYFAFGFGIGGETYGNGTPGNVSPAYNAGYTVWTDFFFQAMFAATCCTIVSGAVAGRIKLLPFLFFCVIFSGVVYPIVGSWEWGAGWLDRMDFADFAGSTLVHGVGGAGALAGALILGPRLGKYAKDGTVQPIPGHSMPLATIGVFLLWFGWFGFNGGSELTADPEGVSAVLVTTTFAACGGGLAAATISWILGGKPDLSMTLNGILAGLVGITAGPDMPSWVGAFIITGIIPGILVYFSVILLDKIKIDDPVGAISVHGTCGIYGTMAVAFSGAFEGNFGNIGVQTLGAFAGFIFAFVCAAILFSILKATMGIRVSEHEEIEGLDLGEHDMSAYPDFQMTMIRSYHSREI